jgi:hypothetical protein
MVVQIGGAVYTLANPCLIQAGMFSNPCWTPLRVLVGIQCASVLLSVAVVNIELMPKIKVAQREQLGLSKHTSDSKQGQMSGWAAASSKSVYREVVKVRTSPIILFFI